MRTYVPMKPRRPYKAMEYEAARQLRVSGMPIKRIADRLQVSHGTVSVWVRDIELTPAQKSHNLYGPDGPGQAASRRGRAWSERCRRRRLAWQEEGRAEARQGDRLHLMGCMLYWAEGGKERNAVRFSNSDAHMTSIFRRFLTDRMGVDATAITMSLNVYTGNGRSIDQIEDYWTGNLGLPRACLRKHLINHMPTSSSGRRRNKLPNGVCSLWVHSTRTVQRIYGAIQEYAGFDEPAWLD